MKLLLKVWMVFLSVALITPFFSKPMEPGTGIRLGDFGVDTVVATAPTSLKMVWILGGAVSLALSGLWLKLTEVRKPRHLALRMLGFPLFALAALGIGMIGILDGVITPVVLKTRMEGPLTEIHPGSILDSQLLWLIALLVSYHLCFREEGSRKRNVGRKDQKIRYGIGIGLVLLSVFWADVLFLILAGILISSAYLRWCPVYSAMCKSTANPSEEQPT